MQKIILEFLQNHGEAEYNDILHMILNHEKDFSVSNIRSIVNGALHALVTQGLIVLTAYKRVDFSHKYYYKIA